VTRYARGQEKFREFARSHGVQRPFEGPITAHVIVGFLVWEVSIQGFQVSTVRQWKAGVRSLFVDQGMDVASFKAPMVRRIMRGLSRKFKGTKRAPKLPITTAILERFLDQGTMTTIVELIMFAAACVGVYGMFRAADIVFRGDDYILLVRSDITWMTKKAAIELRGSKHDYFHTGESVWIHDIPYKTSPFHWLKLAFQCAPDQSLEAALFQHADGSPITYLDLQRFLKRMARDVGIPPKNIATRSLKIGGATTLAALEKPEYTLKTMGRWKSMSYQLYTHLSQEVTRNAFMEMGQFGRQQANARSNDFFGGLTAAEACEITIDNAAQKFERSRK
jgi:hypothetical protein